MIRGDIRNSMCEFHDDDDDNISYKWLNINSLLLFMSTTSIITLMLIKLKSVWFGYYPSDQSYSSYY